MTSRGLLAAISAVVLGACGADSSGILPLLIEHLMRYGGLSDVDAGFLGGVGLLGSAASIVLLSLMNTTLQRPSIGFAAAALLCGANVFCALWAGLPGLLLGRFVAGFAEGVLLTLMSGYVARSSAPEQLFGVFFFAHNALVTIIMANWSSLIDIRIPGGVMGPFAILAGVGALAAVAALFYPPARPATVRVATTAQRPVLTNTFLPATTGLLGIYLFNVAAMGVWSFIVPFARTLGLTDPSIQSMLVVSNFAGFAGAIVPMVFGRRLGRTLPIVLGFSSIALVSFSAAVAAPPALIYIGAQIYSFAWVFLNPYISGAVATLDADGRVAVLGFAATYLGLASGPAITGWLSGVGLPLPAVFFGFAAMFVVSCAAILVMIRLSRPLTAATA